MHPPENNFRKPIIEFDDVRYHLNKFYSMIQALKRLIICFSRKQKKYSRFYYTFAESFCKQNKDLSISSDCLQILEVMATLKNILSVKFFEIVELPLIYEGTNGIQAHDFFPEKF